MANKYQSVVDLYFTENGDFFLGANEDLEDTKMQSYRGFVQRINTIVASTKGEWKFAKDLGANVSSILGKRNTQEEAEKLKTSLLTELLKNSFISSQDIAIYVFPLDKQTLAIILEIIPPGSEEKLFIKYSYSVRDNRITPRT